MVRFEAGAAYEMKAGMPLPLRIHMLHLISKIRAGMTQQTVAKITKLFLSRILSVPMIKAFLKTCSTA